MKVRKPVSEIALGDYVVEVLRGSHRAIPMGGTVTTLATKLPGTRMRGPRQGAYKLLRPCLGVTLTTGKTHVLTDPNATVVIESQEW